MTSLMDDPMMRVLYMDALTNLSNGMVSPVDREVLSHSPLPSNFIDPYVNRVMDARQTMDLTFSALGVWVGEAEKASYFSTHFVTLSKMINSGVTTMARGLVTLHMYGEDLSGVPMSMDDLLRLASSHFRKSYLGVLQTVKTHPEISERLLVNQLSWCNTLMRLFKTKEKLAKTAENRQLPQDGGKNVGKKQLPGGDAQAFEPLDAAGAPGTSFAGLAPLAEQGAVAPARAYTSLAGPTAERSAGRISGSLPVSCGETDGSAECPENSENTPIMGSGTEPDGESAVLSEKMTASEADDQADPTADTADRNHETESSANESREKGSPVSGREGSSRGNCCDPDNGIPDDLEDAFMSEPEPPPEYQRIFDRASRRSADDKNVKYSFSFQEIILLLQDPEFCRDKPEMAARFRQLVSDPPWKTAAGER